MKVAILGNMNNNGFSMMRYFRDLGVDAHLLLYRNDGTGSLSHFTPQNDTLDWNKWAPYVHQTSIVNSPYSAIGGALGWLAAYAQLFIWKFRKVKEVQIAWISKRTLACELEGYDLYIGSGIAPALFLRTPYKLDCFYPYATGVEFLGDVQFVDRITKMGRTKAWLTKMAQNRQKQGLERTGVIFNAELGLTKRVLNSCSISFKPIPVPMFYPEARGNIGKCFFSKAVTREILASLEGRPFFLAVSRQVWVKPADIEESIWENLSKHSDWLFRAYADVLSKSRQSVPKLVVLDYGVDADHSKELCYELGISENVAWIPKMGRKELIDLVLLSSAVIGEFKTIQEMIWGGVGWESLACGKALIHSFDFEPGRFEKLYGYSRPPVLKANSREDVQECLEVLVENPEQGELLGRDAKVWFDTYNGKGSAERWLSELNDYAGSIKGKAIRESCV